jgi:hypothetical protein
MHSSDDELRLWLYSKDVISFNCPRVNYNWLLNAILACKIKGKIVNTTRYKGRWDRTNFFEGSDYDCDKSSSVTFLLLIETDG